jgi:tight adherence protein B
MIGAVGGWIVGVAAAIGLWRAGTRAVIRDRAGALRRRGAIRVDPTRVEAMLERAGVEQSVTVVVRTWLLLVVAAGLFGAALGIALGFLFALLALVAGPVVLVLARHRAEQRAAASMPTMLRIVASELRIGGTVASAVQTVEESPHPLARDMARVRARVQLGAPLADALATWVVERPITGARAAAGALTLASTVGGPAADAVDGLAASVADRIAATAETRAQSAQARASALVMVLAPVGYLLFASTIDQRSLGVLLGTGFGRACLGAGLVLDALAIAWIRFLVRPEPEA